MDKQPSTGLDFGSLSSYRAFGRINHRSPSAAGFETPRWVRPALLGGGPFHCVVLRDGCCPLVEHQLVVPRGVASEFGFLFGDEPAGDVGQFHVGLLRSSR